MHILTDFDEENLSIVQGFYCENTRPSPPRAELQAVRDTCAVINELIACNRTRIDKLTKKAAAHLIALRRRARAAALANARRQLEREKALRMLELQALYHKAMSAAAEDCLALVIRLTEALTGQIFALEREPLLHRVEEQLSRLLETRAVRLTVNPADRGFLLEKLPEKVKALAVINASEDLVPGEALIETAAGQTVISWRRHLAQLNGALLNTMRLKLDRSPPPPSCRESGNA